MEGIGCSFKEKAKSKHKDLLDLVFSWSLEDIFNEELYKDQVEKIPESFESVQHYLGSFVYPLLEEIRAELASSLEAISSAPFAEVESYKALPGDFFVFTEAKPETVSDLQRVGRTWTFGSITKIAGDDNNSMGTNFKVKVSNDLEVEDGKQKFLYMVFLMNITTNKRIWNALHRFGNLEVIKKVLCIDTLVEEICDLCPVKRNEICAEKLCLSSTLNKSQYEAVVDSICKMQCNHKSFVKLIWGPPGTGKTRTLSLLLWNLLGLKCRTLVCAPTNAAITEVASRVLELVKQSLDDAGRNALFCCLGDILLFGNKQQMKVCSDFEEIYLDYRVEKLAQCLGPVDGWKHCFASMIEFFEGFVSWYQKFRGNDLINEKEVSDQNEDSKVESKLFLGSVRENFETSAFPLRRCVSIFCTHLPKSLILEHNFRNMVSLIALLDSFETLLLRYIVVSEVEFFSPSEMIDDSPQFLADTSTILYRTTECLTVLRSLQKTLNELNLPCTVDKGSLVDFCFKMASPIFCTASSSYKLHSVVMEPLQLLVIDEAAQLKECESIIPLQLPGTRDAILIGDEFQLPAIVNSNVSDKAGFGRSLFERMSLLGHPKHLLDTQYRMHPSISLFPNSKFYNNQIIDAPNVKNKNYKKRHLPGPMFGPYSFINISGGKETLDVQHSRKNMVEVAVVLKIVQMLYKACNESKEMLSVGVVSPYTAQVAAIQQKLGQKYENHCSFTVKVKSIDRYQGGEDDIIILSTVRSTSGGSIGFISSPHRTNVALTRARNCLWILGNEKTLTNSGSVWKELITDAKVSQCYFNADKDEDLTKVIVEVKKELDELDDLLNGDSILFKAARWKVLFSDIFRRSFVKLKSSEMRNLVLLLLLKLCNGWRPKRSKDIICESSLHILKKFKVQGLYIICSVDIVKELWYIQVLKVWDILPLEDIPKLVRRLDGIFGMYTDDYLNHCKVKCFERDLLVPATWASSADIVQYKDLSNTGSEKVSNDGSFDRKIYVEDSRVNDSLLLMKFYSLSSGVVSHLLSGCDGRELGLPFELTDQEKEIIFFNRSTFILGSFVCGGDSSAGSTSIHMDDIDDTTQFFDIPDSFVDLPPKSYPLVITFHKFLMMLDGTVAVSYFERFPYVRQLCHGKNGNSRSIALETFIRTKEVNYHRFSWAYWPHFNIQITNKLESTRVFTEIMSVIKGGLRAGEDCDGKLSRQDFVLLSESRGSTLSRKKRERIYDIFLQYEKKKVVDGDFDLADLVNDLHHRLKEKRFVGDGIDFVYIDEVQDLSIRQIALFKYICRNVEEGFVFAGDTAQTIARGVDFRFEDIRCLFYKEFLRGSGPDVVDGRIEKGQISDIFHLSQNFRTHGGVLNLAQSVIDLLYHFFPLSIDILSLETSLLYGEAPILLDSKNNENVIRTIFQNGGTVDWNIVCFGAEQVILVRDDSLRKEICDYVGKKALVLTILECKGLEFQDVLLYKFFSSSPFKNKWRVIYEYMKERDLLDSNSPPSFPSFNQEKHNLLCSEMKQLYVAITRTKQRLWICENVDELSEPMFHYWKKLSIVQVRQLDDSFIKEMQVASSRDEWKSRGIKEAAEIFDSIGKAELAAQCFFKSEEYETAGKVYLEQCGDSKLDRAGECFSLAGCYKRAAEVYARAKSYSMCLSACIDGKLFDFGLVYIQSWKLHTEMDKLVLDFLQQGALYYYELKNSKAMMKFVESFHSMDSIRSFLKNLNCLDELLLMEKEQGNFLEAADIAKLKKDLLLEADLIEKAGYFREASLLILWYVFSNSLHPLSSKCRPPKWLTQKDKLLTKAKSTAKNHSDPFYDFVCKEAEILSEEKSNGNVFEMGLQFIQFWKQKAPTGVGRIKRGYEIDKIEQDTLERCAHHYHDLKDNRTMMRYVKAFHSRDLIRSFLKNLNCLDELLSMEKEWGNFLEAADIAKLKKDLLLESDLVEKAGYFREASLLILWYVFSNSLPPLSSKCSPPKWLTSKDKLLTKAMSIAKNNSDPFYEFVCKEAEILSEEKINGNVFEMGLQFIQLWKQKAPTGVGRIKRGYEIDKIEQDMLERCAHHYNDLKDNRTMMRYVKSFHSRDLIRSFLKNLNCLDELLLMEKEWGNFLEAADIAKLKKDLLLESDLVEKDGI
ncbi:hypothetical protein F0562_032411 [Nyssa sinensis]|uniref:UvrD-like helicase ATP-binding domain-containing protein n=1 Tax=Nyssa sinensis TaxID=561372 RepID=A0A5J5APV2_9ASTE|nr:hypothetical protein F0562_032411 [Nyssa sinensis]